MNTKYPIILVHGIFKKELKFAKAFGRIESKLKEQGFVVFSADTDGFGCVENNAKQLKIFVEKVLKETGAEKVNLICHSKGGLDSKYMITELGMEDFVASMTTLSTPFGGSIVASKIWELPRFIKGFIGFWMDVFFRILGDKHPESLKTCEELRLREIDVETLSFSNKIYCQSYSTTMEKGKDDFTMFIPYLIHKKFQNIDNDGLVSKDSSKFGIYKGNALEGSVSHSQIIDFMAHKSQKEKVYGFYIQLCSELAEMGF